MHGRGIGAGPSHRIDYEQGGVSGEAGFGDRSGRALDGVTVGGEQLGQGGDAGRRGAERGGRLVSRRCAPDDCSDQRPSQLDHDHGGYGQQYGTPAPRDASPPLSGGPLVGEVDARLVHGAPWLTSAW